MRRVGLILLMVGLLGGCDDEPIQVGRGMGAQGAGVEPVGPAADPSADAGVDSGPALPNYRDEDFVEADSNRDPFRNYAASFQVVPETGGVGGGPQRPVEMPDTSVEEMRLIGIVSGVADPRAMIVDRDGVGHTVRRGVYIGRSEIVQAGGTDALPVELNWRVDRIRPNEIVLTREDPTAPNRPPLTRVMPLREEDARLQQQITPR